MAHLFPIKEKKHEYKIRKKQKYNIQFANTERTRKSPIIFMQTLLNKEYNMKHVAPLSLLSHG